MKKLIAIFAFLILATGAFSQAPDGINYQAVIRDNAGAVLTNSPVGMKIAIRQTTATGTVVYEESFTATTSAYGLVNIVVGQGSAISGNFASIDWSSGPYFVEVSADETGGTNYSLLGTQQLMSVAYSLYSNTAENATNDQVNDADADPTNELQDISLSGTDLSISNGSTVDLSSVQDGTGTDDQNISGSGLSGTNLTISIEGGASEMVDLSSLQDGTGTDDQNISGSNLTGTNLTIGIEGGASQVVDLFSLQDGVNDADADPTNELQTWTTLPGIPAEITDGDDVDDADADPTNEIQSLTLNGTILSINGGNSVDLAPLLGGGGGSSTPTAYTILVGDDYFDPEYLEVNVGDTITWQWVSGIHTTTSNNTTGNDVWDFILSSSNPTYIEVIDDVDNHYYYDQLSSATGLITTVNTDVVPSGTVISYAGNNIPVGWKVCDGSAISRTTYQYLFLSIGTSWGEGDGATTFNLPDLRGQFLRGVNNGAGVDPDAATRTALNIGGNVGDTVGTYQQDEVKAHDHGYQHLAIGGSTRTLESTPFGNNSSWQNFVSDLSGGLESRPKNASVYFIIKL